MQNTINHFLLRVVIFLGAILTLAIILYPFLRSAFLSNVYINITIILTLIFGLIYTILDIINLGDDSKFLQKLSRKILNPKSFKKNSLFIKILSKELYQKGDKYTFISSGEGKILEEIDIKLATKRETSKYLVGLLIFLGLLGTFWGLLNTIGSVGDVIGSLAVNDANMLNFFDSLKEGLNEPLKGMSTAFSSSLFGLAGSLILGFVDLQMGQSQSIFLQNVEKFIRNNSAVHISNNNILDSNTDSAIQKLYDNLGNLTYSLQESSQNQDQIFSYIQDLTKNLKEMTSFMQEQDKKLSNFLSTQLNTQASMLQLTTKLTQHGVMDESSKKHLKNLDLGIQKLITISKKNK